MTWTIAISQAVSLREKGVDLNTTFTANDETSCVSLREKGVDLNINAQTIKLPRMVSLREKGVDLNICCDIATGRSKSLPS